MTYDDIKDQVVCSMWTLYKNPSDFPDRYVARECLVLSDNRVAMTQNLIISPDLLFVKTVLEQRAPGRVFMHRATDDDPCIVGVYL